MKTQKVEYSIGETRFIHEVFATNTSGPQPGVLVFPEAFGLNDHARERARRLAELGYTAMAVDLHGEGRCFPDLPSVIPTIQALYADRAGWRARARAAFDALARQPQVDARRIGAIGFCLGGATCLELARTGAPLAAMVSFHGGLQPGLPEDAGRITGKVLACHGAGDPLVKKESIEAVMAELQRDKVDWQFVYYGNAVHSFTEPAADGRGVPGIAYDAKADQRSWAAMRALFDEAFA